MILLTGATGFVGAHLLPALKSKGCLVRAAFRSPPGRLPSNVDEAIVKDLTRSPELLQALSGVDTVVHLAGRAHVLRETSVDVEAEFHRSNVEATRNVAEQAAAAGVRRLVFLSSIKVNGESTAGRSFTELDSPGPQDAYGRSKHQAELALWEIAAATGLEVVVIRPPLVYGPGVKANFLRLLRLVHAGIPLPFASVRNHRSLVGVGNLCDLICLCCTHPAAAGETFLVSDQHDLSTPELIQILARAMGRSARLFPFPALLLRTAGRAVGRSDLVERLVGSLQVDSSKATGLLGWRPTVDVEEGLARTARWYVGTGRSGD